MSYPKIVDYVEKQIKGLWGTDFDDNGIPVIKTNNLSYEGIIDYSDICKRNIDPKQAQNNYLQKGDLLIEKSGGTKTHSVGYVSYFDEENDKYLCNNFILALRPKHKEINSKYLFYQIQFKYESNQFSDCFNKTTGIQNLKVSDYLNKEIKVPDIKKQNDIVLQLDKTRDVITKNKALLEKYDILIKSRFIEMFGDPVTNSKGWNTKNLQEVAPAKQSSKALEKEVWLLNLDMVESQTGRIIDFLYVDITKVGNSTYVFDEDNVLYSKLRPYLNKVVVPMKAGICTSELVPLRPNAELNKYFLAELLRTKSFVSFINEKVAGAKMPRVSMDVFRKFECILPPIEQQEDFASFVQQIDKSKFENDNEEIAA